MNMIQSYVHASPCLVVQTQSDNLGVSSTHTQAQLYTYVVVEGGWGAPKENFNFYLFQGC